MTNYKRRQPIQSGELGRIGLLLLLLVFAAGGTACAKKKLARLDSQLATTARTAKVNSDGSADETMYDWIRCESDWGSDTALCGWALPPASWPPLDTKQWQMCYAYYSITLAQGDTTHHDWPNGTFPGDPPPARIQAWWVLLNAAGGSIIDQYNSIIQADKVGVHLIPASATVAERQAAHCVLPPEAHPGR